MRLTTPSSISSGAEPGYTSSILMIRLGTSGKKVDFILNSPAMPSKKSPTMMRLAATGNLMK